MKPALDDLRACQRRSRIAGGCVEVWRGRREKPRAGSWKAPTRFLSRRQCLTPVLPPDRRHRPSPAAWVPATWTTRTPRIHRRSHENPPKIGGPRPLQARRRRRRRVEAGRARRTSPAEARDRDVFLPSSASGNFDAGAPLLLTPRERHGLPRAVSAERRAGAPVTRFGFAPSLRQTVNGQAVAHTPADQYRVGARSPVTSIRSISLTSATSLSCRHRHGSGTLSCGGVPKCRGWAAHRPLALGGPSSSRRSAGAAEVDRSLADGPPKTAAELPGWRWRLLVSISKAATPRGSRAAPRCVPATPLKVARGIDGLPSSRHARPGHAGAAGCRRPNPTVRCTTR